MKTQCGLTGIELGWFESYLMNREQVCILMAIFLSSQDYNRCAAGFYFRTIAVLALHKRSSVSVQLLPVYMLMTPRYLHLLLTMQILLKN